MLMRHDWLLNYAISPPLSGLEFQGCYSQVLRRVQMAKSPKRVLRQYGASAQATKLDMKVIFVTPTYRYLG